MFNFSHSLLIGSFLLLLVPPVAICGVGGSISWGMGVENPHVEKCSLECPAPKAACSDIEPCSILGVSRGQPQRLFSHWLELWLDIDIVAHFGEESCGDVPDLVVPDGWESTLGARESVLNS